MTWADAIPNLLIGLREGLEAGLVVSILLAALRKVAPPGGNGRVSAAPVWLGVLGAATVAGSFAAVLTFSDSVLSSRAQQAVGGLLSVLAVGLVTSMVFWMRRTAAGLGAQLRGDVQRAVVIGAGALTVTAFLAVGREGLETTLFLWTAVRASGPRWRRWPGPRSAWAPRCCCAGCCTGGPPAERRVVLQPDRDRAHRHRGRCAVLRSGDLQDAGLLPGQRWIAFDLTAHVDPNSWWVSIVIGVTELSPRMTVLQVVAWVTYLAVVIPAFVQRRAPPRPYRLRPQPTPLSRPARPRPPPRRRLPAPPRRPGPAGNGWPRAARGPSPGS